MGKKKSIIRFIIVVLDFFFWLFLTNYRLREAVKLNG